MIFKFPTTLNEAPVTVEYDETCGDLLLTAVFSGAVDVLATLPEDTVTQLCSLVDLHDAQRRNLGADNKPLPKEEGHP